MQLLALTPQFAHDGHGHLQGLLVVEAGIDLGAIGALEAHLVQTPGAAQALGDIVTRQLDRKSVV